MVIWIMELWVWRGVAWRGVYETLYTIAHTSMFLEDYIHTPLRFVSNVTIREKQMRTQA